MGNIAAAGPPTKPPAVPSATYVVIATGKDPVRLTIYPVLRLAGYKKKIVTSNSFLYHVVRCPKDSRKRNSLLRAVLTLDCRTYLPKRVIGVMRVYQRERCDTDGAQ